MGKEKKDKKDKKDKKEKHDKPEADVDGGDDDYDILAARVTVISRPLADKKLSRKIYKTIERAHKVKRLARGVKEVTKSLRKGDKGVCVIAGNISPLDVITHIPVMCEESSVPYCYVPTKEALGAASQTKRPTSVILVKAGGDVKGYDELMTDVTAIAE